jgi:hypothetical protein
MRPGCPRRPCLFSPPTTARSGIRDVERFGHDSAGGLRGMKGDAWEGGHRMPFIVRWPGRVKPGNRERPDDLFHRSARHLRRRLRSQTARRRRSGQFQFPAGAGRHAAPGEADPRSDRDAGGQFAGHDDPVRRLETHQSTRLRRILGSQDHQTRPRRPAGQLYNLRDDPAERTISIRNTRTASPNSRA